MKALFQSCYRNRRVLVTGNTGFKGSWLALWLKELGAEVFGLSKDVISDPSHFRLLDLDYQTYMSDIRDPDACRSVIDGIQPAIVFHLAAQALVRPSYARPRSTIETNVMGTVNILEACRQCAAVRAIVNVTSDKCYRNTESVYGYRESDPLGGRDPYSASKGAAEIVSQSYRQSFFNPVAFGTGHTILMANARSGNVIGGGDWAADRLVPDLVRTTQTGLPVVIRYPGAYRPWQHVLEPLSGYLRLGQKLLSEDRSCSDDWNFGPGQSQMICVQAFAEKVQHHWEAVRFDLRRDPSDAHEATLLTLDCAKAHSRLEWRHVWDFDTACRRTMDWYKNFYRKGRIDSRADIEAYVDAAKKRNMVWAR